MLAILEKYKKFTGLTPAKMLKEDGLDHNSARLLKNSLKVELNTPAEEETHIVGYLKAILYLAYCGIKGLEGEQFTNTKLKRESQKFQTLADIPSLIELIQEEIR
jgi:hypothetical protein